MKNTIKWKLGRNWHNLHPKVQRRFNRLPTVRNPIIYQGNMEKVRLSRAGWMFAFLTRIIGNPLTPYQGDNVPMIVELTTHPGQRGVYWQRTYHFENRQPYKVTSVKKDENGKMMECVGAGFDMYLDVYAENEELHFKSSRYFWKISGFYLPLPHILSPGETHVIHQDLNRLYLMFTLNYLMLLKNTSQI